MKFIYLLLSVCLFMGSCSYKKEPKVEGIPIIPKPLSAELKTGQFELNVDTRIAISSPELNNIANYFGAIIQKATDKEVLVTPYSQDKENTINLIIDSTISKNPEAYNLSINSKRIMLKGASSKGILMGIQSIRQLLPTDFGYNKTYQAWEIPAIEIKDQPAFAYRGIMLDISRHFYSQKEIQNLIDLIALYKFNKLHIHLTDDQGWRIEIKKYPELTQKGAFRKFNSHDRECMRLAKVQDNPDYNLNPEFIKVNGNDTIYGGYFTQNQMKQIVAYAGTRGIDVLPEIDMPGHFMAALHQYPNLSCFNKIGWGDVFSTPLCLGKDESLEFCKNVLSEIFDIFPYPYIHIGGDEVDMTNWNKCANCQKRMRKEHLKNGNELQSWFNNQIEKFLNAHGKKLIGWDEIVAGGLSKTSTVMYWRPWAKDAARKATDHGNYVIQTPDGPLYLDAQENPKTLKQVYDYNPITPDLTKDQAKYILGAQGNIWSETIASEARMQYRAMPRMFAISELAWTKAENKNWDDFVKRLPTTFERMDAMGINYRIPDLTGFNAVNAFVGKTTVTVNCMLKNVKVRYTTDGSIPNESSTLYTKPLTIDATTHFRFRSFYPNGKKGDIFEAMYLKQDYAPGVKVEKTKQGLKCDWHLTLVNKCAKITDAPIHKTYTTDDFIIPNGVSGKVGLIFTGYINIPAKDIYTFALTSDDGSQLYIDKNLVIDHDGPHGPVEKTGQIALDKGWHPVKLMYFDMNNGGQLKLHIYNQKGEEIKISKENLAH